MGETIADKLLALEGVLKFLGKNEERMVIGQLRAALHNANCLGKEYIKSINIEVWED